jgi:hypothetical protein
VSTCHRGGKWLFRASALGLTHCKGRLRASTFRRSGDARVVELAFEPDPVPIGPLVATMEPMVAVELERVEALEFLGMTLAHLNVAESRAELSLRIPLLMIIRDKLAVALQEDT